MSVRKLGYTQSPSRRDGMLVENVSPTSLFGRGCASSGLSWQAAPANKGANAGTACKDRVDKVEPCPNSRG
ncbi:MAG: hypothetical protein LBD59_02960, partial [Prevotellaceae bacterium]|nr:hypothetical protein [Prevotellaceae bacterium]